MIFYHRIVRWITTRSWGPKVGLAARVAVGAVLIYAGASKTAAPAEEFAYVIQAYDIVPASIALPMAGLLPWIELLIGWALILGIQTREAAVAARALFAMFLIALGSVVARGIGLPNCGCFGDTMHFTPLQAATMDFFMLLLCWIAFHARPAWSLDSWSERGL